MAMGRYARPLQNAIATLTVAGSAEQGAPSSPQARHAMRHTRRRGRTKVTEGGRVHGHRGTRMRLRMRMHMHMHGCAGL